MIRVGIAAINPQQNVIWAQHEGDVSIDRMAEIRQALKHAAPGGKYKPAINQWWYKPTPATALSLREVIGILQEPLEEHESVAALAQSATDIGVKEAALRQAIAAIIADPAKTLPPYRTVDIPAPWRHQQAAWHWGVRVPECLYLAHKPGTGKTRSGADILRGYLEVGTIRTMRFECDVTARIGRTVGGTLIVCPKVVVGNWMTELFRFQQFRSIAISGGSAQKRQRAWSIADAHICSYGSLKYVVNNMYDVVICDEAHSLADEESTRSALMMDIGANARRRIALSGTPISNMLPSLWSQYYWLDCGRSLGTSKKAYLDRYFDLEGRKYVAKPGAEDAIIAKVARITHYVRKEDALPDMPAKMPPQPVYVQMTDDQRTYYQRVRKEIVADIQEGTVTAFNENLKKLRLFQICQGFVTADDGHVIDFGNAKVDALKDMLTGDGDLTDRKVIVWCRFTHDIERVSAMLMRERVPHLILNGDTKDRDGVIHAWNNDYRYRVFVGMIQMGIGINLHAPLCVRPTAKGTLAPYRCSATVYYALDWSSVNLEQSMDRTHRGDQAESCLYRFILCADLEGATEPVDVKMFKRVQSKVALGDRAFNVGAQSLADLVAD
jgi:hypothetical protein